MSDSTTVVGLLGQLEAEFAAVQRENRALRARVANLEAALATAAGGPDAALGLAAGGPPPLPRPIPPSSSSDTAAAAAAAKSGAAGDGKPRPANLSKRLENAYRSQVAWAQARLRVDPYVGDATVVLAGHADGVADVTTAPAAGMAAARLVASASVDGTVRFWAADTGACLGRYSGHTGAVNTVRFHPRQPLAVTASGDGTAHIVAWPELHAAGGGGGGGGWHVHEPVRVVARHADSVVSGADWLAGGTAVATAVWDHTVGLWDAETGAQTLRLSGHALEVTGVCAHPVQKLLASSSRDQTFRLWDFRQPAIHEVNVFQGHTAVVNSAVFAGDGDNVVSASDDKTVKTWDLRNMRAALHTVYLDAAANRVAVSAKTLLVAVPLDNGHVKLFDLAGNRLLRLPRRGHRGHTRMATSVAWGADGTLYSAGMDGLVYGWAVGERKRLPTAAEVA